MATSTARSSPPPRGRRTSPIFDEANSNIRLAARTPIRTAQLERENGRAALRVADGQEGDEAGEGWRVGAGSATMEDRLGATADEPRNGQQPHTVKGGGLNAATHPAVPPPLSTHSG
jgi:hypothetical protein